jgi:hypothetical protein
MSTVLYWMELSHPSRAARKMLDLPRFLDAAWLEPVRAATA